MTDYYYCITNLCLRAGDEQTSFFAELQISKQHLSTEDEGDD